MPRPWNPRTLLLACETALKRPDSTLRVATIRDPVLTAKCEFSWDGKRASDSEFVVDPAKGGLVESFLHEALHVVLAQEIGERFNPTLDEVIIKALERELWMKIKKRDLVRWRALLAARIEK